VEFAVLFVGIPLAIAIFREELGRALIPVLLGLAAFCLVALLVDRSFDRRRLWNSARAMRRLPVIMGLFAIGAAGIAACVALFTPDRLLSFPLNSPEVWLMVMLLYPLLSVYPQEIIYRTFFFHRYEAIFPSRWLLIGASALAFGWMHIVFWNVVAVALTVLGGAMFAWTYHRTRSTFGASLEHALYGCFVFTIGLGWYFYGGRGG